MADETKNPSKNGMTKLLLGAVLLVVVVIVAWSLIGYPPKNGDVQGTIGTADKYRQTQVTEADVKLDNPELQNLLQNDKVLALFRNENFRKAIQDPRLANLFTVSTFRQSLAAPTEVALDPAQMDKLKSPGFNDLLAHATLALKSGVAMDKLVGSEAYARLVKEIGNRADLRDISGQALVQRIREDKQLDRLVREDANLVNALGNPHFQDIMASANARASLIGAKDWIDGPVAQMAANPAYADMVKDVDLLRGWWDPGVQQFMRSNGPELLRNSQVSQLFTNDAFAQALKTQSPALQRYIDKAVADAPVSEK